MMERLVVHLIHRLLTVRIQARGREGGHGSYNRQGPRSPGVTAVVPWLLLDNEGKA